jgi:carboxylesterase type B
MEFAGAQMAQDMGCGPDQPDVMQCLRSLSFDSLAAELAGEENYIRFDPQNWNQPTIPVADGMTYVEETMFYLGKHKTVPLLIGYNADEMSIFQVINNGGWPCPLNNDPNPCVDYGSTQQDLDTQLGGGTIFWLAPFNQEFAGALDQTYQLSNYPSVFTALEREQTDQWVGMSARRRSIAASSQGTTVYGWVFTHGLENPNDPNYPYNQVLGAAHVLNEDFIFGDVVTGGWYQPTPAEVILSNKMGDIWTNFAKNGDPNGPGIPTWPRYSSVTQPVMLLDENMRVAMKYRSAEDELAEQQVFPVPWWPLFPVQGNGPCTNLYYCLAWQAAFQSVSGQPLPSSPYAPNWNIVQYPPTKMMLDAIGTNAWDTPP